MNIEIRNCEHCGQPIPYGKIGCRYALRKFCSETCRKDAWRGYSTEEEEEEEVSE